MKYTIEVVGVTPSITLTAESKADTLDIFELANKYHKGSVSVAVTGEKKHRHYKKQYIKTCAKCGRKCKGNIGLGLHACGVDLREHPVSCDICHKKFAMGRGLSIHRSTIHGIKSTNSHGSGKKVTTGFTAPTTGYLDMETGDITVLN